MIYVFITEIFQRRKDVKNYCLRSDGIILFQVLCTNELYRKDALLLVLTTW
jgi:hypothetical protein